MTMDDHDADGSRWRSIAEAAIEEVTCPDCGGTGGIPTLNGSAVCDRCGGTGLITREIRSLHDEAAAKVRRQAAGHLALAHGMAQLASRHVSDIPTFPPYEQAMLEFAEAQTHALLSIATSLKGA